MDIVNATLSDYAVAHSDPADEVLRELAEETHRAFPEWTSMQITQDQGAFLTMLVRLIGARTAVEVGTFTGYSSICIARGLPADGRLLACDVSEEWTSIARRYWERAGVAEKIDLRLAPAADTLRALPRDEQRIDFAFIDADKPGYPVYYEEILPRLRPGGLIVLDNTLLSGRVADEEDLGEAATALRRMNAALVTDERVDTVLLTLRDGVTLLRKR
ncbi:class I SAM-dependent methyltransferase [Streptomyces sp. ACA25]|uniref:O-methyltransferase n=1 Tax=Streptomyces sp. ACA25 TaxID=3022596 RepID=UPI002306EC0D|nr:class I SAM-dependent methyltransferase [Streptomyces sp. ACA25]MDB1090229.1 class I SAM-dependent methyltransferase [Streptomyces sp. ACA25]